MRNPFIILTALDGSKVRINITQIVTYRDAGHTQNGQAYTYVQHTSPCMNETSFKESAEEIDEAINAYYGG
tara:strand:+ start:104 stop:316 length:213 start_codon:yes stop_codon:yes gene_type:complete